MPRFPLALLALALVPPAAAQSPPSLPQHTFADRLHLSDRLTGHRKNYILFGTWDSRLRDLPSLASNGKNRNVEVKFQLSFRYPLWERDVDDRLVFAYTGVSFWQVYAFDDSSPFRTTDHEPELFWETDHRRRWQSRVGLSHQSNGESGPANRSWNRAWVEALYAHTDDGRGAPGTWTASLKAWTVFGEATENEDIEDFMGPFELAGEYFFRGEGEAHLSARLRNNLDHDNRGAFELTFSILAASNVRIVLQYFNGYGESLLDFDDNANRVGIGLEFSP